MMAASGLAALRQLGKPADVPIQTKDEDVHRVIATTDDLTSTAAPTIAGHTLPFGWRHVRLVGHAAIDAAFPAA